MEKPIGMKEGVLMKKIIPFIIAMFVMSTTVFAMSENDFLAMLSKGSTEEIHTAISEYGEEFGFNLNTYDTLTYEQQLNAIHQCRFISEYDEIKSFGENLHTIATNLKIPSGSSGGGSSASGGGGSGGSGSIKPVTPVFPYTKCTFQGTVSLPDGEVAPEGGIEFEINFPVVSSSNISYGPGTVGISQSNTTLFIPCGENSVDYSINWYVRDDTESLVARVLLKTNPNEKYLYGNCSEIIEITSSNTITADVHIKYPDSYISGCFTLGSEAELLTEKTTIDIVLHNTQDIKLYSNTFSLLANTRSFDFTIPAKQGEEYIITYKVNAEGMKQQHISPNTIVYSENISVDKAEITGVVLEPEYREVISGTISLPSGMSAPEGGLQVQISGASTLQVFIPENESSVDYIIAKESDTYFTPIQKNYDEIIYKEFVLEENATETNVELKPLYSVYGIVTISETAIDDIRLSICASLNEFPDTDRWDSATSITIPEGSSSATFCIEIENGCPIDDVYLAVFDETYSDKYVHYGAVFSKPIQLLQYNNEYSFDTLNIEKTVEVFKGTIQIPDDLVGRESRIIIDAYSTTQDLSTTVWTDGKSESVDFILYGETSDFEMYNGEYVFRIKYNDYSRFDIHYNAGNYSIQNKTGVIVNNETVVMEVVPPKANLSVSGEIVLPTPVDEEIDIILTMCDQNDYCVGDRIITVPSNTAKYNFTANFVARTDFGNYKIMYSIDDANTTPYAEGNIVYVSNDGYTENFENAVEFIAENTYSNITVDLTPFECTAVIQGSLTIPFGIVPRKNTYFNVEVIATNGEYRESDIVTFEAGESSNEYSIAIPDMYSDGIWQVYYVIGSITSIPSAPNIPTEIIRDSDFSIPISAPSTGGGGGQIYGPKHIVPSRIIKGLNVYYSSSGMVFDEGYAKKFKFNGEPFENIDFTIVTMDSEYPRSIGGYFLSVKDKVEFTVELIEYETGKSVAKKTYTCIDEATWYEFNVTGEKPYIIKFSYEDKEYYYMMGDLITEQEDAFVIEASANPKQYKYNVYYENIKKYHQTTRERYLRYEFDGSKYDNVNALLCDKEGNIISKSSWGKLTTVEQEVYIGIEYCGQIRYLCNLTRKSPRDNTLLDTTSDIREAKPFTLPHISESGVMVTIDISDFTSGTTYNSDGNIAIKESYLNYENLSDCIKVESVYIDIVDGILDGNNTLYIAFYGDSGQLTDLKSVTELTDDKTVPLGFTLESGGCIKVMCFQPQLQPMFNVVQFFELNN